MIFSGTEGIFSFLFCLLILFFVLDIHRMETDMLLIGGKSKKLVLLVMALELGLAWLLLSGW